MRAIIAIPVFTAGNFAGMAIVGMDWHVAFDRAFFQGMAIAVYLLAVEVGQANRPYNFHAWYRHFRDECPCKHSRTDAFCGAFSKVWRTK